MNCQRYHPKLKRLLAAPCEVSQGLPRVFCSIRLSWINFVVWGGAIVGLLAGVSVAEEASLTKVQQALRSFRSAHGHAPTDRNFIEMTTGHGVKLDRQELILAWDEVGRLQKPKITAHDLVELIKSKKASMQNMRQNYLVRREELDGNGQVKTTIKRRYTFVFSGNKLLLEKHEETRPDEGQKQSVPFVKSYDGKLVRLVDDPKGKIPHASITQLQSRGDFYGLPNVLVASMLINSVSDLGMPYGFYDLVHLIEKEKGNVFEQAEKVGDAECVVVASLGCRVFLDSSHDFSVVRVEEYGALNDKHDRFLGLFITGVRQLKQLKDYGNGVWLPATVEEVVLQDGKPISRETTVLESAEINKGISDDVFADIIPKNAMVSDGIRKIVYRFGRSPSIEGTLLEAVEQKGKSKHILLWLNIVSLVVLVIIVVIRMRRGTRRLQA